MCQELCKHVLQQQLVHGLRMEPDKALLADLHAREKQSYLACFQVLPIAWLQLPTYALLGCLD